MEIYWEKTRRGQKLILSWEEREEMIGGIRETKTGFDGAGISFTVWSLSKSESQQFG